MESLDPLEKREEAAAESPSDSDEEPPMPAEDEEEPEFVEMKNAPVAKESSLPHFDPLNLRIFLIILLSLFGFLFLAHSGGHCDKKSKKCPTKKHK